MSEEILARVNNHILDHGHAVQFVGGSESQQPFGYTVGRTLRERPELLISAPFPPAVMGGILNEAVRLDDETPINAGTTVDITTPGGLVTFFALAISAKPMITARATFGPKLAGLQLVWPDDAGRYPWQDDYKLRPESQHIYTSEDA